ncbi:MAG: YjiH family protein [Cellulosilyticaceae bacterium]
MGNASLQKRIAFILKNLKFIVPSLIGIFLFMIPISQDGNVTIPVAILSNALLEVLTPVLPYLLFGTIIITAIGSLIAVCFKPKWLMDNEFLHNLFYVAPVWFVLRMLAAVFISCTLFGIGPEIVWSELTGGLILDGLLPTLFSIFFFAGLLLPLLLNFGLLEFVGSLLVKLMRPIFKLPGRSAIDCIASWLGDGTIGVLLTSKQYEEGFYSEREATIIGTNFSLVSITFSLIIINEVGLAHLFIPFYLTVTVACIVAAILVPKFGPLKKKQDVLFDGTEKTPSEELPEGYTGISYGFERAVARAEKQSFIKSMVIDGSKNVLDMWLAVIPMVMAIGTIALIIAEFTPFFKILGLPFVPLLSVLGIPEAMAAGQTLIAGFADMLLPSVMATSAGIESNLTLFVIASISVSQLIYLSEVGAVLLASKIPVNLKELFIIFLQRTLITLPVIALFGHLFASIGWL